MTNIPQMPPDSPQAIVASFFRKRFPDIYRKVQLQVRRTPRRQTGAYKTNRASRWKLDASHPDYTAPDQIPLIEAKLFAMALEFESAIEVPPEVGAAASAVLGHQLRPGTYRCPITGRMMNFQDMLRWPRAADRARRGEQTRKYLLGY